MKIIGKFLTFHILGILVGGIIIIIIGSDILNSNEYDNALNEYLIPNKNISDELGNPIKLGMRTDIMHDIDDKRVMLWLKLKGSIGKAFVQVCMSKNEDESWSVIYHCLNPKFPSSTTDTPNERFEELWNLCKKENNGLKQ